MTTDLRRGDAVGTARERRSDLRDALLEVEAAIAAPLPGRRSEWTDRVRRALLRLRGEFETHVRGAEGPEGLFDEIRVRAPRLSKAVERLANEHPELASALDTALARCGSTGDGEVALVGGAVDAETVRDAAVDLLGRFARHRQRGADLVYEAYAVDIGGSD